MRCNTSARVFIQCSNRRPVGAERDELPIGRHTGKDTIGGRKIDLVDDQDHRHVCRLALDIAHHQLVAPARWLGDVHNQADDVGIRQRRLCLVHHVLAEPVQRLVKAGRVQENHLSVGPGKDSGQPLAGRLRLVADDCDLLAQPAVDQSGFADVRPADHGNKAGAMARGSSSCEGSRPKSAAGSSRSSNSFIMRRVYQMRGVFPS